MNDHGKRRPCARRWRVSWGLDRVVGATSGHKTGFKRSVQSCAKSKEGLLALCLSPCNVLSSKVALHQAEPAEGCNPCDDFPHSIDYHGAGGVSSLSATEAVNQPVASVRN